MPAVIEAIVLLMAGVLLGVVLNRTLGKSESSASVKLVRTARTPEGREETRLLVNDVAILTASNDGVRLAEYADEVEQLEAVAARLASSMGVTVEFARVGARLTNGENGIPMRNLPAEPVGAADEDGDLATRRTRLDDTRAATADTRSGANFPPAEPFAPFEPRPRLLLRR